MSDWRKICCAVDFSPISREALRVAVSLAVRLGAELTLIHVVDTGEPSSLLAPPERADALVTEASLPLRNWAEAAAYELGAPVTPRIARGVPADEIARVAREIGSDLLVLGTHARHGVGRALFGSVADKVVRHAPCPILTVRPR